MTTLQKPSLTTDLAGAPIGRHHRQPMVQVSAGIRRPGLTELQGLVVLIALGLGAVIAFGRSELLPQRLLFDSERIQQFVISPGLLARDGSYRSTATLWRLFTDGGSVRIVGLVTFAVFAAITFSVAGTRTARVGLLSLGLIVLSLLLGAVFVAGYTKEFFVAMVVLAVVRAPRGWQGEVLGVAALVAYGSFVRQYWLLIAAAYLALRVASSVARPVRTYLIAAVAGLLVASVLFPLVLGFPLYSIRDTILTDITATPDSAIAGLFANGTAIGDVANPLIIWIQLQFPVHLLVGSAVQVFGTVAIIALWAGFWVALWQLDRARFSLRGREGRCAALIFSCLLALSLFEPDFGSYLRHLAPMAPAVLCLVLQGGRVRVPNRSARH